MEELLSAYIDFQVGEPLAMKC